MKSELLNTVTNNKFIMLCPKKEKHKTQTPGRSTPAFLVLNKFPNLRRKIANTENKKKKEENKRWQNKKDKKDKKTT